LISLGSQQEKKVATLVMVAYSVTQSVFGRLATVKAGLVSDREMGRPSTRDKGVGMTETFLFPASQDICS
jgi:hypothetical protein